MNKKITWEEIENLFIKSQTSIDNDEYDQLEELESALNNFFSEKSDFTRDQVIESMELLSSISDRLKRKMDQIEKMAQNEMENTQNQLKYAEAANMYKKYVN